MGETSCLTGQPPPASSLTAPSQLGADPPTSACFSGCLELIVLDMTSGCYSAPGKQKKTSKKFPVLRFASWNVWNMCPGLSENLQQIVDTGKTVIIDGELLKLHVSIAALQETRLASSGSLREKNYTPSCRKVESLINPASIELALRSGTISWYLWSLQVAAQSASYQSVSPLQRAL